MGEVSRTLAVFPPFEYAGKSYKVERRTFLTEGKIEVWLEERALAAARRHADGMSPYEFGELLRIWNQDVAAFVYSFNSVAYHKAMATSAGLKVRCFLDLKQANPRVTEELLDRVWADEELLPTGQKHPQTGEEIMETWADRLVNRFRDANAPLSRRPAPETAPAEKEDAAAPGAGAFGELEKSLAG